MQELTGQQRKHLRSLAHALQPVCYVGKNGLSDPMVESVRLALSDHELVKVKFNDHKDEKKALAAQLEQLTDSNIVGLIGNIAILYRQQPDEEKRKISL